MARQWIVTVLGKDRPGIVAGVTKVLYQLGCNLEDSAMRRLGGEFTVMLVFSSPARVSEEALRRGFRPLEQRLTLIVHLKRLTKLESRAPRPRGRTFLISVYGADRPGIVFRVSDILAREGINITDVHAHRSEGRGPSLYLLLLEVELPTRVQVVPLEERLKKMAKSLSVEVNLRPSEAAVL